MKIGVVSDTHNNLKNVTRIVELFNEAGVDRVIHTGDVTQAKTLDVFAKLKAPMFGVWGNNDVERESLDIAVARYGFEFVEPPLSLSWHGHSLVVVHNPEDLTAKVLGDSNLVLHGHTHRQRIERDHQRLIFNPGECAGHMHGFNVIGIVDLVDLQIELLKF